MNECPPGILCINHSHMFIIGLLIIMFLYIIYNNNKIIIKNENKDEFKENINNLAIKIKEENENNREYLIRENRKNIENNENNNLNRLYNNLNPLIEPLKSYPDNRINIKTRGENSAVQQVGTLIVLKKNLKMSLNLLCKNYMQLLVDNLVVCLI